MLHESLDSLDIARWTEPHGGYFISFYTKDGLAKRVVDRCMKLGVKLTPAGSSYPYHKDPNDSNIRIAPSFLNLYDLERATKVLSFAVKYETIKYLLGE